MFCSYSIIYYLYNILFCTEMLQQLQYFSLFAMLIILSRTASFDLRHRSNICKYNSINRNSNAKFLIHSPSISQRLSSPSSSSTSLKLFLGPQIIFVASCVAAVVGYIYNNIDSIREVKY